MTAAGYGRRLAALPTPRREDASAPARPSVPVDAVSEDAVLEARGRHPEAFAAIDSDLRPSATEVAARARLVTEPIRVDYRPPE